MLNLNNFVENKKYFITFKNDCENIEYKVRARILRKIPRSNINLPHYIIFQCVENSNSNLFNNGTISSIPLDCIIKAETLQNILNNVIIDDIINVLDHYI